MSDPASRALLCAACPSCGGAFECGANAGQCACFGIRLNDVQRADLAARFPGRCLCLRCLRELVDAGTPEPLIGAANASG